MKHRFSTLVLLSLTMVCAFSFPAPAQTKAEDPFLRPFTAQANYMSLFGYLRYRGFWSGQKNRLPTTLQLLPPTPPLLAGTTWRGPGVDEKPRDRTWQFDFLEDGTLRYKYWNGTYTNGTWVQSLNVVYLEVNDKYLEQIGVIQGNQLVGVGRNQSGLQWDWSAKKQEGARYNSQTLSP